MSPWPILRNHPAGVPDRCQVWASVASILDCQTCRHFPAWGEAAGSDFYLARLMPADPLPATFTNRPEDADLDTVADLDFSLDLALRPE